MGVIAAHAHHDRVADVAFLDRDHDAAQRVADPTEASVFGSGRFSHETPLSVAGVLGDDPGGFE